MGIMALFQLLFMQNAFFSSFRSISFEKINVLDSYFVYISQVRFRKTFTNYYGSYDPFQLHHPILILQKKVSV